MEYVYQQLPETPIFGCAPGSTGFGSIGRGLGKLATNTRGSEYNVGQSSAAREALHPEVVHRRLFQLVANVPGHGAGLVDGDDRLGVERRVHPFEAQE